MSFRTGCFSLLLAAAFFLPVVRAQTSVYATGGLAGYNVYESGGTLASRRTGGFGVGAFYNFPIQSRVTVGLDARTNLTPGDRGGYLAGAALRVGFVPHHVPLRPFLQIGGGVVHASYPYYAYGTVGLTPPGTVAQPAVTQRGVTSGAAQVVFGLDIRLTDHLDLRAPDWGAQAGAGTGLHADAAFFNVGLVYHLRPVPHS